MLACTHTLQELQGGAALTRNNFDDYMLMLGRFAEQVLETLESIKARLKVRSSSSSSSSRGPL